MGNNVGYVFTLLLVVEIKDKLQKRIISTVLYLYIVLKALLLFFLSLVSILFKWVSPNIHFFFIYFINDCSAAMRTLTAD